MSRLPDYVAAYFRGWAGDGECLREGLQAWQNLRLRPAVLRDSTSPNTATSVLGTDVSTPILVAPMAQQVAAHPDGELATAQAAAAVGTVLGVSTNTAVRFDAIQAVGAPWWFQVYVMRDRTLTHRLVERAVSAGARARAVHVGRPVMWGLAAHGPQGAQQVLERLHDELLTTMLQLGVSDPSHLNPGDVNSRA